VPNNLNRQNVEHGSSIPATQILISELPEQETISLSEHNNLKNINKY
jgi:hypothetical protein